MNDKILQKRYRKLAYLVVRDAIGFYFGIPKFLETASDTEDAFNRLCKLKRKTCKSEQAIRLFAESQIADKIAELEDDYENCCELLFNDNIWYQLLDLDVDVVTKYLNNLTDEEKETLAIVPRWITSDYALGRSYLNEADRFSFDWNSQRT